MAGGSETVARLAGKIAAARWRRGRWGTAAPSSYIGLLGCGEALRPGDDRELGVSQGVCLGGRGGQKGQRNRWCKTFHSSFLNSVLLPVGLMDQWRIGCPFIRSGAERFLR